MSIKSLAARPLALAAFAALGLASGASQANITVYTSQAAFLAATTAPGTDTFAGLSVTSTTPSPLERTTNIGAAYDYVATASTSVFFGAGTVANPNLSPNISNDSILFNNFITGISAIGGNFFGSNDQGGYLLGSIVLTATDSTGPSNSVTYTLVGATVTSFVGFVSDASLVSLEVASITPVAPNVELWPSVDNLVLAQAIPVPEPETYALMLSGLAFVTFLARRRASNSAD